MAVAVSPAPSRVVDPHRRHRRAWYWYDWANSAYVTTTGTVLFAPYLTAVAKTAACPGQSADQACHRNLHLLGLAVAPGSLAPYTITVATVLSAILLLWIGAVADRSARPARLLGLTAWVGAAAACAMVLVTGTRWLLGAVLLVVANMALAASLVVYDSLLCRIATPDDRDRVSSRGWALGYLGGGLLLAVNLAVVSLHQRLGLSTGQAIRISLLSAGLWWAVFTAVPVLGLWSLRGVERPAVAAGHSAVGGSVRQLLATLRELRNYPQTLLFLLAALFFNDGIQTVITSASLYGSEELRFSQSQLMLIILLVQFVAFGGALLFGRCAARLGAWRTILGSLVLWTVIVVLAFLVPRGAFGAFVALAVGIGLVLGGSQALARSLFSQLAPRGREAEFFSLYQSLERGTSWFGTLAFGLVYQASHSYRWALVALIGFFVVGGLLLARVDVPRGIREAGNPLPNVV